MTDHGPADPFTTGDNLLDYLNDGATLYRQLAELDTARDVLRAIRNLKHTDLGAIVLAKIWAERWTPSPDRPDYAAWLLNLDQ
jgi:hypothetical protein